MARFNITFEAAAGDTDGATRQLRGLLKLALRGFGLKCVGCRIESEHTEVAIEKKEADEDFVPADPS